MSKSQSEEYLGGSGLGAGIHTYYSTSNVKRGNKRESAPLAHQELTEDSMLEEVEVGCRL